MSSATFVITVLKVKSWVKCVTEESRSWIMREENTKPASTPVYSNQGLPPFTSE